MFKTLTESEYDEYKKMVNDNNCFLNKFEIIVKVCNLDNDNFIFAGDNPSNPSKTLTIKFLD